MPDYSDRQRAQARQLDKFFSQDHEQAVKLGMEREVVRLLLRELNASPAMAGYLRRVSVDLGLADDLTLAAWNQELAHCFPVRLAASGTISHFLSQNDVFRSIMTTSVIKEYLGILSEDEDPQSLGFVARLVSGVGNNNKRTAPAGLILVHANVAPVEFGNRPRSILAHQMEKNRGTFYVERFADWVRSLKVDMDWPYDGSP